MNKKIIGILVSLGAVCAIIFGVAYSRRPVTITLGVFAGSNWDVPNGNSYQVIDDAIARFQKEHPNVKIVYDSGVQKEDYSLWLSEKIVSGKEPDVFLVPSEDFNTLSSLGAMKKLDALMSKDLNFDKKDYYKSAVQSGVFQKSQYALPYESNPTLMFVNKTLLEKEGIPIPTNDWTLEDFYKISKMVTKDSDNDGIIDQYGYYDYTWLDSVFAHGTRIFDEEGYNSYLSQDSFKQAINFVNRLQKLNQGYPVSADDFDKGNIAFSPMPLSQYRTYKPYPWRVKKYSNFEWDCVKMPTLSGNEGNSQTSTLLMGMSANTKHTRLAWEFLKMLCYDQKVQQSLIKYSQGLSPLKKVTQSDQTISLINEDTKDSMVNLHLLNEVMEGTINHSQFKKYQSTLKIIDTSLQQLINSNEDMDTSLLTLQREVDQYLKE